MDYRVLTIGLTDELFSGIQSLLIDHKMSLTSSLTVRDASRLLTKETFHLLLVDLEYLRDIGQMDWLTGIRRISFIPVIVVSKTPEEDIHTMIQLGADICVSGNQSHSAVADLTFAQVRRYTEYNHYRIPSGIAPAPFQVGDISIDPVHHTVEVQGHPVNLRPREFSLLLFFMENPNAILTSAQICEGAWELEGGYDQGVSHPVRLLRKAIEPNPSKPIYIKTVHRLGYRFIAHNSETCERC